MAGFATAILPGQEALFTLPPLHPLYPIGCSYGLSTGWTGQDGVELSRDVALQTADDLGLSLSGPPLHVGAGGCMPGHPADRDQVQRRVRLAVAATAQPMAGGRAG